jgi:putative transposase
MPKPRPPFLPGHYYHFYNRGGNRQAIFHEPADYIDLLKNFKEYARTCKVTAVAYCLLPNHYHFLLRQDSETEARILIQRLFNQYGKIYRAKYKHSGSIFEGPYQVKVVAVYQYLRHLCRYIHANPVKHGLVSDPADWPYANYLEWLNLRSGALVDRQFVTDNFPNPNEYQEFVWDYLRHDNLPEEVKDYLF